MRRLLALAIAFALAACATLSPRDRIESRLVGLGVSERAASCLAGRLADNLDRRQLAGVADFLEKIDALDRGGRPGGVIDALLGMDDPRIVAEVAAAGFACALRG